MVNNYFLDRPYSASGAGSRSRRHPGLPSNTGSVQRDVRPLPAKQCRSQSEAASTAAWCLDTYPLADEPYEDYQATIRVNQDGVWWTCREAVRQMLHQGKGGRIIATASIAGLAGCP